MNPTTYLWPEPQQPTVTTYRECRKNHAARFGGVALDGCLEFTPLSTTTTIGSAALKCAACGCHRNFHHRVSFLEPGPTSPGQRPLSPSPLSYCVSSPRMLRLALNLNEDPRNDLKRSRRTSFSREQREKMRGFAEKVGWRLNVADEETVTSFCKEIRVTRSVLRNWINNNKMKNRTAYGSVSTCADGGSDG